MKKISILLSCACLSLFCLTSSIAQARTDRPLCAEDCANSPVPIKDLANLSAVSKYVTREQIEQISKELLISPPKGEEAQMITVPVVFSKETFDPDKHAPKKNKALPIDEGPESALFLSFNLPSSLSTATEGRNRLSFNSTSSNSMLHKAELERKDGGTRTQKLDGIGEVNQMTVERGNKDYSITMSLREYRLIGSPSSILAYPTGDKFIEKFHTKIGAEDPFHRKRNGMNQVGADIKDPSGKSLNIKENQSYIMPLIVHLKKFDKIESLSSADGKSETTLVTGVQAAVPLGSTFRQGGIGTTATLIHNRELREGLIATFAAGMAVNVQRTFGDGYQPFDKPTHVSWGGDLSAGITCIGKKGSATSFTLYLSADPAPLHAKDYKTNTGAYLKRQSQAATTEHDYAVGVNVTHQTQKGLILSGGCKEDFGGSHRKPKTIGGNNNRDFSCGFSVSKNF